MHFLEYLNNHTPTKGLTHSTKIPGEKDLQARAPLLIESNCIITLVTAGLEFWALAYGLFFSATLRAIQPDISFVLY